MRNFVHDDDVPVAEVRPMLFGEPILGANHVIVLCRSDPFRFGRSGVLGPSLIC